VPWERIKTRLHFTFVVQQLTSFPVYQLKINPLKMVIKLPLIPKTSFKEFWERNSYYLYQWFNNLYLIQLFLWDVSFTIKIVKDNSDRQKFKVNKPSYRSKPTNLAIIRYVSRIWIFLAYFLQNFQWFTLSVTQKKQVLFPQE